MGELLGVEEEIVQVTEGVEGYTVLRDEREELVGRVVQHGCGEEAAGGGDESRGGALSPLGGDESVLENARRRGNLESRVGVDVDVEQMGIHGMGAVEEELPERGEVEVSVSQKEEGDFGAA